MKFQGKKEFAKSLQKEKLYENEESEWFKTSKKQEKNRQQLNDCGAMPSQFCTKITSNKILYPAILSIKCNYKKDMKSLKIFTFRTLFSEEARESVPSK